MSSESRLPGDPGSTERDQSDIRTETRLKGTLADRFETALDDADVSEAQLLRDALDEFLPAAENSEFVLPPDPSLRDAYTTLAKLDEKRVLPVEKVEDILSNESHPNTPKDLIRSDVIEPLDEMGFFGVGGGRVAVHPLTRREEVQR